MKMSKRSMMLCLSLVLAIAVSVAGTIAYLTSSSATLTNTFTVGKVGVKVDETVVDEEGNPQYPEGSVKDENGNYVDPSTGNPVDPVRDEKGNDYRLVPGKIYIKDPTMTVKAHSEVSYVRMLVTINKYTEMADLGQLGYKVTDFVDYDAATSPWKLYQYSVAPGTNDVTYEFRYATTVETMTSAVDKALEPLFTSLTIPGAIPNDGLNKLNELSITVVGHAIQAEGFADADAAWKAFEEQIVIDAPVTP